MWTTSWRWSGKDENVSTTLDDDIISIFLFLTNFFVFVNNRRVPYFFVFFSEGHRNRRVGSHEMNMDSSRRCVS